MTKRTFALSLVLICVFMVPCAPVYAADLTQDVSYAEETFRLDFKLPDGWEEKEFLTDVSYNDKKWVLSTSDNIISLVISCEDLWISAHRNEMWAALSDSERSSLPDERQSYDFVTAGIQKMYMDRFAKDYQNYSPSITAEEMNGVVHIKIDFSVKTTAGDISALIYCVMRDGVYYGFTFTTPYPTQENRLLIENIMKSAVYQVI